MSTTTRAQSRHWSRHAEQYDDVFLDSFAEGVENPIVGAIAALPAGSAGSAIDLGCGTGPFLPLLLERFAAVMAVDFAPGMIEKARQRLGGDADRVRFLLRPMGDLDEFAGAFDVAVAVNSLVMPDVREIDRTLAAIHRALKPGGTFYGVVPAIDAIQYQTMLLHDLTIAECRSPAEADRRAAEQAEHHLYDFAFGRFAYRGLRQKFWQSFEVHFRLRKAGFAEVRLDQVLYPWDSNLPNGDASATSPGAGTGPSSPGPDPEGPVNPEWRHVPMAATRRRGRDDRPDHLFDDDVPAPSEGEAGDSKTFADYLRETPPAPLDPTTKAILSVVGVVVVLLMIAAILKKAG